jgi:hypothetical protein
VPATPAAAPVVLPVAAAAAGVGGTLKAAFDFDCMKLAPAAAAATAAMPAVLRLRPNQVLVLCSRSRPALVPSGGGCGGRGWVSWVV